MLNNDHERANIYLFIYWMTVYESKHKYLIRFAHAENFKKWFYLRIGLLSPLQVKSVHMLCNFNNLLRDNAPSNGYKKGYSIRQMKNSQMSKIVFTLLNN